MTYKVITRSRAPGYRPQAEVIRRFRDFVWLQRRLRREYRGEPRLPCHALHCGRLSCVHNTSLLTGARQRWW